MIIKIKQINHIFKFINKNKILVIFTHLPELPARKNINVFYFNFPNETIPVTYETTAVLNGAPLSLQTFIS